MHRVERMIEIEAPLERVFDLFSDFESFPRWMRHVRAARRTGRRYTRWRADTPFGMDVEWETETTVFEPDHRIAWRSVRGDVDTDGEVVFTEIDPRTTRLRLVLGYAPPAGRVGDEPRRPGHETDGRSRPTESDPKVRPCADCDDGRGT